MPVDALHRGKDKCTVASGPGMATNTSPVWSLGRKQVTVVPSVSRGSGCRKRKIRRKSRRHSTKRRSTMGGPSWSWIGAAKEPTPSFSQIPALEGNHCKWKVHPASSTALQHCCAAGLVPSYGNHRRFVPKNSANVLNLLLSRYFAGISCCNSMWRAKMMTLSWAVHDDV